MTFSIDTNIVIAVSNDWDDHHDNSIQLLKLRKDELILIFTVREEAITTFIYKFKKASDIIIVLIQKTKNLSNFPKIFKQEFEKIIEENKDMANFYRYTYSLIEEHIDNEKFEEIVNIFKNHLAGLGVLILDNITNFKKYKPVYPKRDMIKIAENIESITSDIPFPINKKREYNDRKHFAILCAYIGDNTLDYITTDGDYFLWMNESLNIIKKDKNFENIRINPINMVNDYIKKLQTIHNS